MFTQLDTENGDYDLTSEQTVLTHTPSATQNRKCQGMIELGDGTKNLDGTGGTFLVKVTVGGVAVNAGPADNVLGTDTRGVVYTNEFVVPANKAVTLKVTSPNGADTDVDVVARLFDTGDVNIGGIANDADVPAILQKALSTETVLTVTNSAFTPTATEFEATGTTEATSGHYIGRRVIFLTGNLTGQVSRISAYSLQSGVAHFTVDSLTEAPANGDTMLMV